MNAPSCIGYLHWNDWKAGALNTDWFFACMDVMVTMNVQWNSIRSRVLVGRGGNSIEPNYTNMLTRVKQYNTAHPDAPVRVIPYFYSGSDTATADQIVSGGYTALLASQIRNFLDTYRTSSYLMPDGSFIVGGIELDLEAGGSPSSRDAIVAQLRTTLGSAYSLSMTGNGYGTLYVTLASLNNLDWITLMCYDLYFTGQVKPGYPQTNITQVKNCVAMWASGGWPRSKLIAGLPLYASTYPVTGGLSWKYIVQAYPNMVLTDREWPWTSTLLSQAFGGVTYDTRYPPNDLSIQDVMDLADWSLAGNCAGLMFFGINSDIINNSKSKMLVAADILFGGPVTARVVTWNDGSTEDVEISNGILYLNGVQRDLVGCCIQNRTPYGQNVAGTSELAYYDTVLTWLEAQGFRTVQVEMNPGTAIANYAQIFNLCKAHKMLVNALIAAWWFLPLDLDPPNFYISSSQGYVADWFANCCAFLNNYSNVFAVSADNEIDLKHKNLYGTPDYTPEAARDYMTLITGVIRNFNWTNRPVITTKLVTLPVNDSFRSKVRNYFIPLCDILSFDTYPDTAAIETSTLSLLRNSLTANGYPSDRAIWQGEFNAHQGGIEYYFTPEFLFAAVQGRSVINYLFTSYYTSGDPRGFFNDDGSPKESIQAVALELPAIQGSEGYNLTIIITPAGAGSVTVQLYSGGTIIGSVSEAGGIINYDSQVLVRPVAAPNPGYTFDHWLLDGKVYTSLSTFTFGERTLETVFAQSGGPQEIFLQPGESKDINFSFVPAEARQYQASVDGLNVYFTAHQVPGKEKGGGHNARSTTRLEKGQIR